MKNNASFPSGISSLDPNHTLHPLNLPEVCHLIAQYLSSSDLLACILVSRTFHNHFTPSLWSTFFFDRTFAQPSNKPAFCKHEHLIRNLVIRDCETFLLDNNVSYSNVSNIFNNSDSSGSNSNNNSSMGGVWYTDHCTNLRCLEILPVSTSCNSRIRRQWMTLQDFREDDDHSDPTSVSNLSMTSVSWTQQITERTVDQFMDLMAQQRNLTTLKENWSMISSAYTACFITRICHFPNKLVVLHLSKWHVTVQDLNDLISHSPCLLELTVRGLYITPGGAPTTTSAVTSMSNETGIQHDDREQQYPILNFGQIRRLRFHLLVLRVSPLRMECPAAQSLELSGYGNYYATALDIVTSRGHSWNCPRLQTLQYTGQVHEAEALYEYSEQGALSHILKSCVSLPHNSTGPAKSSTTKSPSSSISSTSSTTTTHNDGDQSLNDRGLKRIALNCCFGLGMGQGNSGGLWQRVLDLHWAALESIDLSYSKGIDSDIIHAIFSTCPRLKRFRGSEDTFAGTTLQKSNRVPWKCLNLERLQVRFVLETSDDFDRLDSNSSSNSSSVQSKSQQQACLLYDQLAVLTHLKVLDLCGYGSVDDTQRGIPLTLKGGLDRLRGLTAMETVHVTGWQDQMDVAEAEWMARHWPKLTNIYSLRNKDMKQWELFLQRLKHAQERVRGRGHL